MNDLSSIERRIIRRILQEAERQGYLVSIFDGEDWTIQRKPPTNPNTVKAIGTTDTTTLMFRELAEGQSKIGGGIWLTHGNDEDVIHDATDNDKISHLIAVAMEGIQ